MKILTVVCDLKKGGTQRVAQVFAESYGQSGHDSRLLALYRLGPRYDELKDVIAVWHGLSDENLQEFKTWRPDVIHIHTHGLKEVDVRRLIGCIRSEFTRVVETNVFSVPSPWADQVDVSFQLSTWALWLYLLRGGDGRKAAMVPNPVHCQKFQPAAAGDVQKFRKSHGIPEGAFVIGRIGQSAEFSWSPLLLRAFNDLACKDDRLYMVVVNPSPPICAEIDRSPFKNRTVVIPELIGDDSLSLAYSSLDLMVHAAEGGESFGLVNAESILCGTPVVTLSTPWISNSQCEVVGNMQGGYVVNHLNGMKKAIRHFMKNGEALGLVQKGGEHIRGNYDHQLVARKALDYALCSADQLPSYDYHAVNRQVRRILTDTFDRPRLLTRLLIAMNSSAARKLTVYTSGCKPLSQLPALKLLASRLRKRRKH